MATVTVAQVRQRFRDRILGLAGWSESTVPYSKWSGNSPPRNAGSATGHKLFSVGVVSTQHHEGRQRASVGTIALSDVRVRCLCRVIAADQVDAEDTAHGLAHDAVKRLMVQDADWPEDLKIHWSTTTHVAVATGEWFVFEARFEVYHLFALA